MMLCRATILFVALGCALAPAGAFRLGRRSHWTQSAAAAVDKISEESAVDEGRGLPGFGRKKKKKKEEEKKVPAAMLKLEAHTNDGDPIPVPYVPQRVEKRNFEGLLRQCAYAIGEQFRKFEMLTLDNLRIFIGFRVTRLEKEHVRFTISHEEEEVVVKRRELPSLEKLRKVCADFAVGILKVP